MHWKTLNRSLRPIGLVLAGAVMALAGGLTAAAGGPEAPGEPSATPAETVTKPRAKPRPVHDDGYLWASAAGAGSGYAWSSSAGWDQDTRLPGGSGWLRPRTEEAEWSEFE